MRAPKLLCYISTIVLIAIYGCAHAQTTNSKQQIADSVFIDGRVLDETKEGMIAAFVRLKADSIVVATSLTDEEGYFHLYHPPTTTENVFVQVVYQSYKTQEIPLRNFKKPHIIEMDLEAGCGRIICTIQVPYRVPLIDPWGPTQRSFTSDEIEKLAR